jgi:hypothetical protein
MTNRRKVRHPTRVIHLHQAGSQTLRRVSELVFVHGKPKAILEWLDMAGDRTPLYLELDRSRLSRLPALSRTYFYDGVTQDPRLTEVAESAPEEKPARL